MVCEIDAGIGLAGIICALGYVYMVFGSCLRKC